MELRNEKDARFIIRHHVTEEKLLHLEKGVRKLGFQSGGKRIMSIFLGVFLLCMAAKAIVGDTIGDALMMIGILCAADMRSSKVGWMRRNRSICSLRQERWMTITSGNTASMMTDMRLSERMRNPV